ncbi:hypothetical protein M5689_019395 [Euphorbia peplus]|nr:hypothetical protein M5689_019395 [Euphorbia peplus]
MWWTVVLIGLFYGLNLGDGRQLIDNQDLGNSDDLQTSFPLTYGYGGYASIPYGYETYPYTRPKPYSPSKELELPTSPLPIPTPPLANSEDPRSPFPYTYGYGIYPFTRPLPVHRRNIPTLPSYTSNLPDPPPNDSNDLKY